MCIAPEVEEVEELEELEAISYLLYYISSSRSKIKVKTVPPLPGCLSHKALMLPGTIQEPSRPSRMVATQ